MLVIEIANVRVSAHRRNNKVSFRGPEHSILINAAFWENTEIMSTENLDFDSKK